MCQVVTNNASACHSATSASLYRVRSCRVLPYGAGLLGHGSGAQMPDSVAFWRGRRGAVPVSAVTSAVADNAQLRATKAQLMADLVTGETPVPGLTRAQVMAVGISVALGLVVFGYGMAGSYVTVSDLAARRGVPRAAFVPAGIDGGLVSVVVLDLVLVWVGTPVGWLRQVVRLLSVGTVVANAVSGWPDPVAVGLHAAAPVMVLAMVEAGRTVLLRRLGAQQGTVRDSIPLIRWALAPWRTALLWRRMVLWQITSYRTAVDLKVEIRARWPCYGCTTGVVGGEARQAMWCGCCGPVSRSTRPAPGWRSWLVPKG